MRRVAQSLDPFGQVALESQRLAVSSLARTISAIRAAVRCCSAASKTICARVLSRASRVVRYDFSKASSCSEPRVGIRIGFMGSSSFAHKLTPLGIYLLVLSGPSGIV